MVKDTKKHVSLYEFKSNNFRMLPSLIKWFINFLRILKQLNIMIKKMFIFNYSALMRYKDKCVSTICYTLFQYKYLTFYFIYL